MAVISNAVTNRSSLSDKASPDVLINSFRAVFWTCFAMIVLATIVGMWGLRGRRAIGGSYDSCQAEPLHGRPKLVLHSDTQRSIRSKKALANEESNLSSGGRKTITKIAPILPEIAPFDFCSFQDAIASVDLESGGPSGYILISR